MHALPQFEVNGILMQMNVKVCSHDSNLDEDEDAGIWILSLRSVTFHRCASAVQIHSPCLMCLVCRQSFFTLRCHAGWLPVTQALIFLKQWFEGTFDCFSIPVLNLKCCWLVTSSTGQVSPYLSFIAAFHSPRSALLFSLYRLMVCMTLLQGIVGAPLCRLQFSMHPVSTHHRTYMNPPMQRLTHR